MNDLTAYIDASMIYGTTLIKSESLRSHVGGKLRSNVSMYTYHLPPSALAYQFYMGMALSQNKDKGCLHITNVEETHCLYINLPIV